MQRYALTFIVLEKEFLKILKRTNVAPVLDTTLRIFEVVALTSHVRMGLLSIR